jgi:hypothetical protein
MTAKQVAAFFAILAAWPMSCACTPSQATAIEAKAKACFERPDVQRCQADALAECVIAGKGCDEKATAKTAVECLRVCQVRPDVSEAGAGSAQ